MLWFKNKGEADDVCISTRIRLARNAKDIPFAGKATSEELLEISQKVREALCEKDFEFLNLDNAPALNVSALVEEHMISPEMTKGANKSVMLDKNSTVSIMMGEEDHIRLQVILPGFSLDKAYEKGMQIALNPSPFDEKLNACDLSKISIFLLNEIEGGQITGETQPDAILDKLQELYPEAKIVLTLGKDGAVYAHKDERYQQPIFKVQAVDTTAAGDTFTGYFLAGLIDGMAVPDILRMSAKASSIAVTRPGAVQSIPYRKEVEEALK